MEQEQEGRRLTARDGGVASLRETNKLVVRVNRPMLYRIDESMIHQLVEKGSFDLLSDGREAELGPVKITGVELRNRRDAVPDSAGETDDRSAARSTASALATASHVPFAVALAAAGVGAALAAFAAPAALRVIRRPPYRAVSTDGGAADAADAEAGARAEAAEAA